MKKDTSTNSDAMEHLLSLAAANTQPEALRSKIGGNLCPHMLASVLAQFGDGAASQRSLSLRVEHGHVMAELGQKLAKRYRTTSIEVTREEFEIALMKTFGRMVPMSPLSVKDWQCFAKNLERRQNPMPAQRRVDLVGAFGTGASLA